MERAARKDVVAHRNMEPTRQLVAHPLSWFRRTQLYL